MERRVLTLSQAAEYIGVSYDTLLKSRKRGDFDVPPLPLTPFKSSRKLYYREAIDTWLKRNSGLISAEHDQDDEIMARLNG